MIAIKNKIIIQFYFNEIHVWLSSHGVMSSILARKKYLYGMQTFIPSMFVSNVYFCIRDTGEILV